MGLIHQTWEISSFFELEPGNQFLQHPDSDQVSVSLSCIGITECLDRFVVFLSSFKRTSKEIGYAVDPAISVLSSLKTNNQLADAFTLPLSNKHCDKKKPESLLTSRIWF